MNRSSRRPSGNVPAGDDQQETVGEQAEMEQPWPEGITLHPTLRATVRGKLVGYRVNTPYRKPAFADLLVTNESSGQAIQVTLRPEHTSEETLAEACERAADRDEIEISGTLLNRRRRPTRAFRKDGDAR